MGPDCRTSFFCLPSSVPENMILRALVLKLEIVWTSYHMDWTSALVILVGEEYEIMEEKRTRFLLEIVSIVLVFSSAVNVRISVANSSALETIESLVTPPWFILIIFLVKSVVVQAGKTNIRMKVCYSNDEFLFLCSKSCASNSVARASLSLPHPFPIFQSFSNLFFGSLTSITGGTGE